MTREEIIRARHIFGPIGRAISDTALDALLVVEAAARWHAARGTPQEDEAAAMLAGRVRYFRERYPVADLQPGKEGKE